MSAWFLWALLAALCWGLGPLFAKLGLVKSDPVGALLVRTLVVLIVLVAWGATTSSLAGLKNLDLRTWVLLMAEGLVASLIGHFAYFKALKMGEVSLVVPVISAYPLIAVLLAFLLLGERVNLTKGVGIVLVVLGIFLIQRSS